MIRKCLSLKQPYADLLVTGKKTIELRTWNTKFRGKFLIHASKNIDVKACRRLKIDPSSLITGSIIGRATLYDVKSYERKRSLIHDRKKHLADVKDMGRVYGFMIKDAHRFRKEIIITGKLGFFNVETD